MTKPNDADDIAAYLGLTWDDISDPKLLALKEKTTMSEFISSLEKIAPYDEYAAKLLALAKAKGIENLS